MNVTEFRIPVPGGEIVGHDHGGTGRDLILVASIGYSEQVWFRTAAALSEFAHVITFDPRGHGQSTAELGDDVTEFVRDIPRLADALELEAPVLIGHQLGGAAALFAANMAPGRFGALCLVDSPVVASHEAFDELVTFLGSDEVLGVLGQRFGLGHQGQGPEELERWLTRLSKEAAADWMIMADDVEDAKAAMRRGTLVQPDGSWMRRPTPETCRRLAHFNDTPDQQPARDMLLSVSCPVWIVQPRDGAYIAEFDDFRSSVTPPAQWAVQEILGGVDLLPTLGLVPSLRLLLATLPGRLSYH